MARCCSLARSERVIRDSDDDIFHLNKSARIAADCVALQTGKPKMKNDESPHFSFSVLCFPVSQLFHCGPNPPRWIVHLAHVHSKITNTAINPA